MDKIYTGIGQDCMVCQEKITDGAHTTTLKVEWDKTEPFDLEKHCTGEFKGYKHLKCLK